MHRFLLTVGIILMLAFFLLTPWLIQHGLSVPEIYRHETYRSLLTLALCLPISVIAMACRGLLEAYQKFFLRNAIIVANGVLMLIAPVVAAMFFETARRHRLGVAGFKSRCFRLVRSVLFDNGQNIATRDQVAVWNCPSGLHARRMDDAQQYRKSDTPVQRSFYHQLFGVRRGCGLLFRTL